MMLVGFFMNGSCGRFVEFPDKTVSKTLDYLLVTVLLQTTQPSRFVRSENFHFERFVMDLSQRCLQQAMYIRTFTEFQIVSTK